MDVKIKKAILQYFKDCIEEDSKESLTININNQSQIFFPSKDEGFNSFKIDEQVFNASEMGNFYTTLWVNIRNIDTDFLKKFYLFHKMEFDKTKYSSNSSIPYSGKKHQLNYYIVDRWANWLWSWLRVKILGEFSNHKKLASLKVDPLKKNDLVDLFFSPDRWDEGIERLIFKPNVNFLNFYDSNKNESFYIILEYIRVKEKWKTASTGDDNIIPPYLIWIEIQQREDGAFQISLKDSEPEFLYNIRNVDGKGIFPFMSDTRGDDGYNEMQKLESSIKWIATFKGKIDFYKNSISTEIDIKTEFIYNPCIITGNNNIQIIKNLIFDYNEIIKDEKMLEDIEDSSLGLLFDQKILRTTSFDLNNLINVTDLNKEQEIVIKKALSQNISVIVWPPWTGKSQIVLNLLTNIYNQWKTVLFASKNNTAVDTVVWKLEKMDLSYYPFLRLGNKSSTELWSGKTLDKLSNDFDNIASISIWEIKDIRNEINDIYEEMESIEKLFIEYYNKYSKMEVLLNKINSTELKKFIEIYDISTKFQEEFKDSLHRYNLLTQKKKEEFINFNTVPEFFSLLESIKNIDEEIRIIKNIYTSTQKWNELIQDADIHNFLLKGKIDTELKEILLSEGAIQYQNDSIKNLKEIERWFNQIKDYNFIWKFFFWKRDFCRNIKKYLDFIDQQEVKSLKDYFWNTQQNSSFDSSDFEKKIKELTYLSKFEKIYSDFNEWKELLKRMKKEEEWFLMKLKEEYWEYFILKDFSLLWVDLNTIKKHIERIQIIKNIWKNIEELHLSEEILDLIQIESNDSIPKLLEVLILLWEVQQTKDYIIQASRKLQTSPSNITELSKKISENQKRLKSLSLDFLAYKIVQSIKPAKAELKDAINGIYYAYEKSKDLHKNKNIFLAEMYRKLANKIGIFVTTNQSTYNIPLQKWFFDYLIIDEASQNDLWSIIPLMYRCKNLIIIWDPNQLQNITQMREDKARRIFEQRIKSVDANPSNYEIDFKQIYNFWNSRDYTLSAFTSINHIYNWWLNQETLALHEHYRCHADIINFSNVIIPWYNLYPKAYISNPIINSKITPPWIFWLKNIQARDSNKTNQNEEEAAQIIEYLKNLLSLYWKDISIGVISPYRNQVNLLNTYARNAWLGDLENITINTVHKFQWDEKDIILYSPVFPKSNLWNDRNLLNVAVSRAKSCFYVFGDKNAVEKAVDDKGNNLLSDMSQYILQVESIQWWKIKHFDSEYEKIFHAALTEAGIKFDFHILEKNGKYELDFRLKLRSFDKYINLEIDGSDHKNMKSYDYTRNVEMQNLWYQVIRYSGSYLLANMKEIIKNLSKICEISK